MKNLTCKIYTLGCKVNQYDSAKLKSGLESGGFKFVQKNADYALVNTCAVTKSAIKKGKSMINKAKKENPEAKIFLFGCFPKIYQEDAKKLNVDYVFKTNELDKIIKTINNHSACETNEKYLLAKNDRARYFIKIQDGCEQFCSYCIIPYSRGKLKSREETEIIKEIKLAIKAGYNEIILSGIHLGLYGLELRSKKLARPASLDEAGEVKNDLHNLLKKIIRLENLGRIRLSSIEVNEITDEIIKLMAGSQKICKHLHLPLQSGCDKILKLMNRPYSTAIFENKIKKIRKLIPDIALSTDIIAGFPGETDKDFLETYNFVKKINFSRLHVFPFSEHEKTLASKLPCKLSEDIKQTRAGKLRSLGRILEKDYKNKFKNKKLEVIIENGKGDKIKGKTEYYFDINFEKSKIVSGEPKIKNLIKILN